MCFQLSLPCDSLVTCPGCIYAVFGHSLQILLLKKTSYGGELVYVSWDFGTGRVSSHKMMDQ